MPSAASAIAWSTADFTQPCQPLGSGIRGSFGLASIVASENEFCKNPTSKDTITIIDSESYDSIGGHKHSLDQDTQLQSLKAQLDWFRSPLFGAKSEQRLVPAPALQADTLAASGGAYPEAPSPATELVGALQCISQHAASKAVDLTPRVCKEKYADNVLKCDVDRVGE
jgi:hypothetical protein